MPIYEYRCGSCRKQFEKIVMGEEQETLCPDCGSEQTQKLLSAFSVGSSMPTAVAESGPCPCGAAERGMCQGPRIGHD